FQLGLFTGFIEVFAGFQDGHNVIGHAQLAENRGFLRQVTNAFFGPSVHGQVADVFIVDAHTAVIRLHQIHNHIETGGFAGTIGAEQADNLAAVHRHGDVFN